MFEEISRTVVLAVVWTVLVLRTPAMLRDRRQRRLWLVLAVFALGSITIQSWFGRFVNEVTGVAQFNNLVQGLSGILNAAVVLEFVAYLVGVTHRRWPYALAAALGMTVAFFLTPGPLRFKPGHPWFTVYALIALVYMVGAAGYASFLLFRELPLIRGRTLWAGLLMVAVGHSTQVPFMLIRTWQRLLPGIPPWLPDLAFVLGVVRFILVPLGCCIAALEPVRQAALFYYRRVRLYGLWRRLRDATEELALEPPPARWRDLLTFGNSWERLHRRVVEIRDSAFYLHDTWAWPQLLHEARTAEHPVAHWLEVTRRAALDGAPQRHSGVGHDLLPELKADQSTMHAEMRYLLALDRAMRVH
ncbi:hypothetical protein Lesp02_10630 [Lentzea sp. NBRC 105346]|uniref:DUF6545 domain-containing protein n=1 Tax=Lentzea sp. NBRC 105346 TaxID=3032205 RepID=UPI0024A18F5A|nr:DUF6545 domain-containing protein [Lentzea sp. NBRC 105346]GLZ28873.1 hypothetical protein Lesp02_10630 [Lentzea sp. NBRC 105346]